MTKHRNEVKDGKHGQRPLTVICYEDLELLKVLEMEGADKYCKNR